MRISYFEHQTPDEVFARIRRLAPRTAIFDVEPLIADWDTDTGALADGVSHCVEQLSAVTGIQAIAFATNSHRRLSDLPTAAGMRVLYNAAALKPFRTATWRDLSRPGVLVGDQIATDGLLAWRLGYSFIHYRPCDRATPMGPQLMGYLGYTVRPFLFHSH